MKQYLHNTKLILFFYCNFKMNNYVLYFKYYNKLSRQTSFSFLKYFLLLYLAYYAS